MPSFSSLSAAVLCSAGLMLSASAAPIAPSATVMPSANLQPATPGAAAVPAPWCSGPSRRTGAGETCASISQATGVPLAVLEAANPGVCNKSHLRVGTTVCLSGGPVNNNIGQANTASPPSTAAQVLPPAAAAAVNQPPTTTGVDTPAAIPPTPWPQCSGPSRQTAAGETCATIVQATGVPLSVLDAANPGLCKKEHLRIGTTVCLSAPNGAVPNGNGNVQLNTASPGPNAGAPTTPPTGAGAVGQPVAASAVAVPMTAWQCSGASRQTAAGETCATIAQATGVSLAVLDAANPGLCKKEHLRIGTTVCLAAPNGAAVPPSGAPAQAPSTVSTSSVASPAVTAPQQQQQQPQPATANPAAAVPLAVIAGNTAASQPVVPPTTAPAGNTAASQPVAPPTTAPAGNTTASQPAVPPTTAPADNNGASQPVVPPTTAPAGNSAASQPPAGAAGSTSTNASPAVAAPQQQATN